MTSTIGYRDVENWSRQVVSPPPPLILRRTSTASIPGSHIRPKSASSTAAHNGRSNEMSPLQTSESFSGNAPHHTKSMLRMECSTAPVPSRRVSQDGYSYQHRLSQDDGYAPGSLAVAAAAISAIAASAAATSAPDGNDIQMRRSLSSMRSVPISPMTSYERDEHASMNPPDKPRQHKSHHRHHHHHHHHNNNSNNLQRIQQRSRHHNAEDEDKYNEHEDNEAEAGDSIRQHRHRHDYYNGRHRHHRHQHQDELYSVDRPSDHENSPSYITDETADTPGTPLSIADSFPLSVSTSPEIAFTPVSATSPTRSDMTSTSKPTSTQTSPYSVNSIRRNISQSETTGASHGDDPLSLREFPMASSRSSVISHQVAEIKRPKSKKLESSPHCCVI
ncbi:uncharacterized protein V1513DRAFT_447526, partial [Lipomyces chichibuensis]|uniref:uncharacterized protein n=1 Tax=Lipomyces chichibuensis TaxID=1546026 RepID=UPI003343A837